MNIIPSVITSVTVKSRPERFAFLKLFNSKMAPTRLTADKFEYANDVLDKSAPARLLFLILVRSTSTNFAPVRFVFSRLVPAKSA